MDRESRNQLLNKYMATQSKSEWLKLHYELYPEAEEQETEDVYQKLITENLLSLD